MLQRPTIFKSKSSLPRGTRLIPAMQSAMKELFFVENPRLQRSDPASKRPLRFFLARLDLKGIWAYYPWLRAAVHLPTEEHYFRLRTARNRNLISEAEQLGYRDCVVGIAGLSVGSAVVSALVRTGGPKVMKLADPDHVEITNLNRMHAGLTDVGCNKTEVAARMVWELDPFAELYLSRNGIRRNKLTQFLIASPRLNVFIDEMDDIALKVAARIACRKARIPVVMATDNGDGIIVDIERYDLEPSRPVFHGRVRLPKDIVGLDRAAFIRLSSKIIDVNLFTERQLGSIREVGKTLSGIPQIGTAAAIAGAAVAYVVRQIATKSPISSGRYVLDCEKIF